MKKIMIVLMVSISALHSIGQTTSPQVVASAGWYSTAGGYSLSQTVGEMSMVATFSQGGTILTEGFQQPEDVSIGIFDFTTSGGKMVLFPNPAVDRFQLRYEFPKEGKLAVSIYNTIGQKVVTHIEDEYGGGQRAIQLSAAKLSSGVYFVRTSFATNSGERYEDKAKLEVMR
ncbi:MAG: hypothetical protein JWO03_162 [Bacteroidetes bacterium]|nr:hypothetical protein [Bacteroidota bacterium]